MAETLMPGGEIRSSNGRRARLQNVQVLRALGALLVVVSHTAKDLPALYGIAPIADWIPGTFGVEIFFFISGFIIFATSAERFENASSIFPFIKQRFLRLVPLYWVCTTLYLAISSLDHSAVNRVGSTWRHILCSYLFIPTPSPIGNMSPVYALGWSLNSEALFYILTAVLLLYSMRIAAIVLTIIFGALVCLHPFIHPMTALYALSKPYLIDFLAGVWAAVVASRSNKRLPHTFFLGGTLCLLVLCVVYFDHFPDDYVQTPISAILAIAIGLVAIACHEPTRSNRVSKFVQSIGDYSYSLYLVHMFVVRGVHIVLQKTHAVLIIPLPLTFAIIVVLSVLISAITYRWIEMPFNKLGRARPRTLLSASI